MAYKEKTLITYKKARLHPLLIILAVAMVSVLFAVSCGGGATSTAVPQAGATQADEAAAEAAATDAAAAEDAAAVVATAQAAAAEASAAEAAVAEFAAAEQAKYGGTLVMAFFCGPLDAGPALLVVSAGECHGRESL